MERQLFSRWADELAAPVAPPSRLRAKPEYPHEPVAEQLDPALNAEAAHVDIPLSEFDAYVRQKEANGRPATDASQEQPLGVGPTAAAAENALQSFANFLATFAAAPAATRLPESIGPVSNDQHDEPAHQPAKKPTAERRHDFVRRHPRTVKLAGVVAMAALASGVYASSHHEATGPEKLVTAPGNLINQGAKIATLDLGSQATVRIPVDGFRKPLMFVENNQPVEPATTLNDTVSITLAPKADKKGNPLPLATVKNGQFVVDRADIKIKATFDDYLALNVDCTKQATAKQRYCVDGSSVALKPTGKLTAETAARLNNMLMSNGSDFEAYYQGVKAKLTVASLQSVEKQACGKQLYETADDVIRALLKNQSAKARVSFVKDSRYPSLSKDYATNFAGILKDTAFSIERGDSKNAIADSLRVTCRLVPVTSKGEK